jgi:predicted RNase H-like HicB family nuclease
MVKSFTAKYTKIDSGYLGQLIEWPEVLTEGRDIEDCRSMLRDALREMILAYRQLGPGNPFGKRSLRAGLHRVGECPSNGVT